MLNVTLIVLGRLKESYLRDACEEYLKRLQRFFKVSVVELQAERLPEEPSAAEIERALELEGKRIAERLPKGAFVAAMCIEGKEMTSEELSRRIGEVGLGGKSELVFIIGSSFGLSETIKKKADLRLSMSRMTFPHQLARVMLLEQIYRAGQISSGGKYHK